MNSTNSTNTSDLSEIPKRPPTAYFIFSKEYRSKVSNNNNNDTTNTPTTTTPTNDSNNNNNNEGERDGEDKNVKVSPKHLTSLWQSLPTSEKEAYESKAKQLKQEYDAQMESLRNTESDCFSNLEMWESRGLELKGTDMKQKTSMFAKEWRKVTDEERAKYEERARIATKEKEEELKKRLTSGNTDAAGTNVSINIVKSNNDDSNTNINNNTTTNDDDSNSDNNNSNTNNDDSDNNSNN
nr:myb-like protein D [Lepeophtheirus salmonis]